MIRIKDENLLERISKIHDVRIKNNLTFRDIANVGHTTPEVIFHMESGICKNVPEIYALVRRLEQSILMK